MVTESLVPPERLKHATFSSFKPRTPSQAAAVLQAQQYVEHLKNEEASGWITRLFRKRRRSEEASSGLYLVGPVGVGKTHLLTAAYRAVQPELSPVYLHSSELFASTIRPEVAARSIAERHQVCCLDEVELDDPANEVRLVRFLQTLTDEGVKLIATSNVEPEHFLSNILGNDRFETFLKEQFRQRYDVIVVEGDDFRKQQTSPGIGWIGLPDHTRVHLNRAYKNASDPKLRISYHNLKRRARNTPHAELIARLTKVKALFIADISLDSADEALRLLRIVDALYTDEDAPVLYFTSDISPTSWFLPEDQHGKMEKGIAEKFTRTISRLYALCEMVHVPATTEKASTA